MIQRMTPGGFMLYVMIVRETAGGASCIGFKLCVLVPLLVLTDDMTGLNYGYIFDD